MGHNAPAWDLPYSQHTLVCKEIGDPTKSLKVSSFQSLWYLVKEVPHLSHFGLKALELLVDPFVLLQLSNSGPFAVQVGAL